MVMIIAILYFLFLLLLLIFFWSNKGKQPWNWPFIGMLHLFFPIYSTNNIFDNFTKILVQNKGTFLYKGPWFFSNKNNMIITCDPLNYQHILSSKFSNYPKGSDTYMLFEPYGEFLFTLDFDKWRNQRKTINSFFSDERIQIMNVKIHKEIFKNGLIPVLDHACEQRLVLDLKDIFKRLFLDITIMSATSYNHKSLVLDNIVNQEQEQILKAIVDINHGILLRHILPEKIWKFQHWLGIGQEKKVIEGSRIIEEFLSKYIKLKNKEEQEQEDSSAISYFISISEHLKKEFVKGLIFASTDTASAVLTWFFLLIQENPVIENKIRQEIETELILPDEKNSKNPKNLIFVDPKELNKLLYLHATIMEAIRLYPSVPVQIRTCLETDILPSGHRVESGMKVVLAPYATARMKSIWGEDCCEYNPERWISSESRKILNVKSTKFCSFSSGSRICPGKELAILRLKSVAATIIYNYDIQLLKDYPITPSKEIMLEMKYPFHAKIKKRSLIK